jgi:TonB family protein
MTQTAKNITAPASLTVVISFFLHLMALIMLVMPDLKDLLQFEDYMKKAAFRGRDIIVNINQDDERRITPATLLSDRDSTAQGYLTVKKGDRWLNNSLDFQVLQGRAPVSSDASARNAETSAKKTLILNDESEVIVRLLKPSASEKPGTRGKHVMVTIPDRNNITRENAIFYSNKGLFSFNTAKYKNFLYFKEMKDKIAGNWYPPLMANAVMGGANPITGTYAPGRTRIMAIPSQEVKLYFTLNRQGDVLEAAIVDSYGNKSLDSSCLDAIRLSKNFGPLPDDIKGEVVVIPFIFGYYAY